MKITREQLKKLQCEWYQKIYASGFSDIEKFSGEDLVLKQTSGHPYRFDTTFSKEIKEEYFYLLGYRVQDESTHFRNEIDRFILTRHSEGAKTNMIVRELLKLGTPRKRRSVYGIIRRYEILWGLYRAKKSA